ncbi:hypothetical protein P792_04315 [Asaia sp. SF2.1]|nr:hypothetical protein P792_04315 [Asaia sp. SF2.1]
MATHRVTKNNTIIYAMQFIIYYCDNIINFVEYIPFRIFCCYTNTFYIIKSQRFFSEKITGRVLALFGGLKGNYRIIGITSYFVDDQIVTFEDNSHYAFPLITSLNEVQIYKEK